MQETDILIYANIMMEIKRRTEVISSFAVGKSHALYVPTTIESACLQVRKILELIAMASLVANKTTYSKIYNDYAKTWNVGELLKNLKKVNPDFYPKPIIEIPASLPGIQPQIAARENDYLTESDFPKVLKECHAIMHAANPFGSQVDFAHYEKQLRVWQMSIMNLLNSHIINLVGDDGFWLIHMQESSDEYIHYYRFDRFDMVNVIAK